MWPWKVRHLRAASELINLLVLLDLFSVDCRSFSQQCHSVAVYMDMICDVVYHFEWGITWSLFRCTPLPLLITALQTFHLFFSKWMHDISERQETTQTFGKLGTIQSILKLCHYALRNILLRLLRSPLFQTSIISMYNTRNATLRMCSELWEVWTTYFPSWTVVTTELWGIARRSVQSMHRGTIL